LLEKRTGSIKIVNCCFSADIATLATVCIFYATASNALRNQSGAAKTLRKFIGMALAKFILPIVSKEFANQGFFTDATFSGELVIIVLLTVWLPVSLQESGTTEWLTANGAYKVLFVPFVIQRLYKITLNNLPASEAPFAERFVIIVLTIGFPVTLQESRIAKGLTANGANKVLWMPLTTERFYILPDNFLFATMTINHAGTATQS
jgi:hypothetical protein